MMQTSTSLSMTHCILQGEPRKGCFVQFIGRLMERSRDLKIGFRIAKIVHAYDT